MRREPFKPLGKDELPIKRGMLCALDAEFVSLERVSYRHCMCRYRLTELLGTNRNTKRWDTLYDKTH